jgi:transposase
MEYLVGTPGTLVIDRRRMGQNPEVVGIAIKAQHRLHKKFWKIARKKHQCTAVTAVARELCGFIWSALWAIESQKS